MLSVLVYALLFSSLGAYVNFLSKHVAGSEVIAGREGRVMVPGVTLQYVSTRTGGHSRTLLAPGF